MISPSFQSQLDAGLAVLQSLASQSEQIEQIAATVRDALLDGHTLLICGNGGSATDAQHLAEELIGRYRANRRALPAIALTADSAALTCIANDFGYDAVFARQVEGLARPGDLLLCFSTSGNSPNIRAAPRAAWPIRRWSWPATTPHTSRRRTSRSCTISASWSRQQSAASGQHSAG